MIIYNSSIAVLSRAARESLSQYVFNHIKHGDKEHKKWLKDKLNEIFRVTN